MKRPGRTTASALATVAACAAVVLAAAGGGYAQQAAPVYRSEDASVEVHRAAGAASPPQRVRPSVLGADRHGADPLGIAVDSSAGRLYWTEYGTGRIRSARLDGSDVRDVVAGGLDGPLGLARDAATGRLYWTSDRSFPRRLQGLGPGGNVEDLVSGEDVNRPGAIAVDEDHGELYWLESVSGRVRRAKVDGSSIDELHEQRLLVGFGIALDSPRGRIYWTDFANGTLQAADFDDGGLGEIVTLLGPQQGLDAPTGLALDRAANELYFADAGNRSIRRTDAGGTAVVDVLTARDGLLDPRGLAVDPRGGRLYYADAGTDAIRSSKLDGSDLRTVVALAGAFAIAATDPAGGDSGHANCREVVAREGPRYVRSLVTRAAICMEKLAFTKAVKWRAADMASGAGTCLTQLAPVGRAGPNGAAGEFSDALQAACRNADASVRSAALAAAPLLDAKDAGTCAAADDLEDWATCIAAAYERVAWEAVAIDTPRALEYVEEIRPFAARLASPPAAAAARVDGVAGLDRMRAAIADITGAEAVIDASGIPFPASGLTTSYGADKNDGVPGAVAVPDDGAVRAGVPMRFVDHGDGTVSDLTTGLMWEKKCDDCGGLHDAMIGFRWSGNGSQETIWDWLDDVNSENGVGFARYRDWRIPNPKELLSIVDYERFNPAVPSAFDGADCGLSCADLRDPACSCTAQGNYWTSTTFSDFPAHAYVVSFHLGLVADQVKTSRFFVRAVRGGPRLTYGTGGRTD